MQTLVYISNCFPLVPFQLPQLNEMTTRRWQYDTLQGAHVHQHGGGRDLFRIPFRDYLLRVALRLKHNIFPIAFGVRVSSDRTARSVLGASLFRSARPLGLHSGHLGRQGRPRIPDQFRPVRVRAAEVATRVSHKHVLDIPAGTFRLRVGCLA